MVGLLRTTEFDEWLRKLKDRHARLRIVDRVDRLRHGNPGDVKPIGRGISELRLTYGPGYRVYFSRHGNRLIILLCGGDKSTQHEDIEQAHRLAREWRSERGTDGGGE